MGFIKGCLKVAGSAALGAAGIASTVLRTAAHVAGSDELADAIGSIQDKSFETIRDMWTPEEEKTEKYYEAQAERSARSADSARNLVEAKRQEYERMRENARNSQSEN